MSGQVETKQVNLQSVMRRKTFVQGFNEVKRGIPLDPDVGGDINQQWSYERGRLFGLVYSGPLKDGNRILRGAMIAYSQAMNDGTLL